MVPSRHSGTFREVQLQAVRFLHRPRSRLTRVELEALRTVPLGELVRDEKRSPALRLMARRLLHDGDSCGFSDGKELFTMVYARGYLDVVRTLRQKSVRPAVAMELLALLVHESDFDTGEIKRSRPALAAELGVSPKVVSELMGELFKLGAVERSYDDGEGHRVRSVRYFLSEKIATHLKGTARDHARASARVLKFDALAPRSDRRSRAARAPLPVL